VQLKPAGGDGLGTAALRQRDDMYEPAVEIVVREGRGSVSLLQRALGIGYGRAARLIDYMAEDGIVGEYNGSQAREVLLTPEQWREMLGGQADAAHTESNSEDIVTTAEFEEEEDEEEAIAWDDDVEDEYEEEYGEDEEADAEDDDEDEV
jgi:S-DNA-T family DNA segregation ATPase FtsK/SpoIIIE